MPKKRRLQSVAEEPEFATPLVLNLDFSRLAENKAISNKRVGTVSFFGLERMEGCAKALLEANSFFPLADVRSPFSAEEGWLQILRPHSIRLRNSVSLVFDIESDADGFCAV